MIANEYRFRASAMTPTMTRTTTSETTEMAFSAELSGSATWSRPRLLPVSATVSSIWPRIVPSATCSTSRNSTMLASHNPANQADVVPFGVRIAPLYDAGPVRPSHGGDL